jgi:threonine dehydratase
MILNKEKMSSKSIVKMRDFYLAKKRISFLVRKTPLIKSVVLSDKTGSSVYLKLENLQETGSFKIRGAANKLLSLDEDEKRRGVIAFSSGNHGRAVSYVARQMGIPAIICVSDRVPAYRVDSMKELGAEVVQMGSSQDEAYENALQIQKERKLTMIEPFDDPLIISGQGTIGIEILEDTPYIDTVVIPLSGGGLISGIAFALKKADPGIRVIGVSMDCAPAMYHSIQAGKPVETEEKDSLADALLGGIGLNNQHTFPMVRDLVDDIILVSEEEIADGMFFAFDTHHLAVEGAGAIGISALLSKKLLTDLGENVVVLLSGGNVDASLLTQIASRHYEKRMNLIHESKSFDGD